MSKIHIGEIIKVKFEASGLSVSEFAKRINCERTNVYNIFTRPNIDVELLISISEVLEYNFFNEYLKNEITTQLEYPNISITVKIRDLRNREQFEALTEILNRLDIKNRKQ